jgi:hypothetical protein
LPARQDRLARETGFQWNGGGRPTAAIFPRPTVDYLNAVVRIEPLEIALREEAKDGRWAYNCCRESRRVHETVWRIGPAVGFVSLKVVPTLAQVADAIDRVPRDGLYAANLEGLQRNIRDRCRNLERYVQGMTSHFADDEAGG